MKDEFTRRKFIHKTGLAVAGAGTVMAITGGNNSDKAQAAQMTMAGTDGKAPDAVAFGKSLSGVGFSLLVSDVPAGVEFAKKILQADAVYADDGFAIMRHGGNVWMLHADGTYHSNPMLALVEGQEGRGRGVELRIYDQDPDIAEANARELGYKVLFESKNKPHGLRECYILDPDGFCWVLSRHLKDGEN
ncbi:MAG TPA: hypothetical protein P5227_07560 [Emcibacteraceae bacterium]|nr:hypothetical protein [Emcibacteraceae bacterium]HRW29835.1 hypothetical protein [Emcibacteraceae bacterium]